MILIQEQLIYNILKIFQLYEPGEEVDWILIVCFFVVLPFKICRNNFHKNLYSFNNNKTGHFLSINSPHLCVQKISLLMVVEKSKGKKWRETYKYTELEKKFQIYPSSPSYWQLPSIRSIYNPLVKTKIMHVTKHLQRFEITNCEIYNVDVKYNKQVHICESFTLMSTDSMQCGLLTLKIIKNI